MKRSYKLWHANAVKESRKIFKNGGMQVHNSIGKKCMKKLPNFKLNWIKKRKNFRSKKNVAKNLLHKSLQTERERKRNTKRRLN